MAPPDGDTGFGVGAPLPRKEDARLLAGRGRFIADIAMPGMRDVAFLRSPVAHARLNGVTVPEASRDHIVLHDDMTDVAPIRAVSGLPGFKVSEQPALATSKVRYVGELVAACIGRSRAEAEDYAQALALDYDVLPAVSDMVAARDAESARVHDHWPDNLFLESDVGGDVSAFAGDAAISVTRTLRTARQCMSPIEGRGVVAYWDHQLNQLIIYTACQMPHIVRTGLSECLGIAEGSVRVIAPDVGGGFGYKGILLAEEVVVGWLAMTRRGPFRWIEDRREQLVANANCREHHYVVTAHADAGGRLLALEAEAHVDSGAYSAYPFSACLEGAQVGSILPGPYDFQGYRCKTYSVATNKCAILPYRGVARTGVCFALEVTLDAIARKAGREPWEIRREILIPAERMPFDNITNKHFDSGDYITCLDRAIAAIDAPGVRERQAAGEPDGRRIGIGCAIYCEQAAHGTSVYSGWGIPMVPGHEQAQARLTPDGVLELRVGVQSHGQSLETTLAQIANTTLGIDPNRVNVVHGDTGVTPYSTGTWGSRCAVMAGGAVHEACLALGARVKAIGAHLLQAPPEAVRIEAGKVVGPAGAVSIDEVAYTWYRRPQDLPATVDPGGLDVTAGYKPIRDTGTFSYAAHAAVVAVDTDLGGVEILDYVIVEDGGTLINPQVVDGQISGGLAQGIGTALFEEMPFDPQGQPLNTTLADYLLPGASEMPDTRIDHMETPSPYTSFGQKGIGEGGAIPPPAVIANAINDALKDLGVEVTELPITPDRLLAAIIEAERT